jgi:DNA repair protein RadD
MVELRDYQTEAVDRVRAAYRQQHRRVLLVAPTGAGKTVIFSHIAAGAARKGNRVLILAHRDVICDQISAELTKNELDHGLIMAGKPTRPAVAAQVGMMGTVATRLAALDPSLIIIDEAHRACGRTYMGILAAFPRAATLLVTATPRRTDGRPMGDVADVLVEGPTVQWLMERGYLSKYRLFCPPVIAALDDISAVGGDYNNRELQDAMNRPEITGDALEHYLRVSPGKRFVAFTTGTAHSDEVAQRFTAGGVPTRNIDGTMKRSHIASVLAALESGEIMGVTSCNLISEGFDLPAVETAILLRPTMSLIVYLQQVGRVLRRAPGKEFAIVLDHVGNSFKFLPDGRCFRKHGLPDELRKWSLDGAEKKKKRAQVEEDVSIRRCSECFANFAGHLRRCPYCAHENEVVVREIEQVDGMLKDLTADKELYESLKSMDYSDFMKSVKSVDEIKAFRQAKGHRPMWAINTAVEKLNVTPTEAARMLGYKPGILYAAGKRRSA